MKLNEKAEQEIYERNQRLRQFNDLRGVMIDDYLREIQQELVDRGVQHGDWQWIHGTLLGMRNYEKAKNVKFKINYKDEYRIGGILTVIQVWLIHNYLKFK